jgi:uncharacterized Fe-S radical SAM superfamily protein PflX
MRVNDQEDVHEDAAAVAAADSSRVTPSPVPASTEAIARETPPLPAVWNSSIYSPPSTAAIMPDGNNDFGELGASLRQQQSNAVVPAGAT